MLESWPIPIIHNLLRDWITDAYYVIGIHIWKVKNDLNMEALAT